MDSKAIAVSLAIITATVVLVFTTSKTVIVVLSLIIFAFMVKGFIDMYNDIRAIIEADKEEAKEELKKRNFK